VVVVFCSSGKANGLDVVYDESNVIGSMKFVTFFPNERSKNNVSNRNTRVKACCQKSTLAREDLDAAHQSIGVVMMYVHMTVVSYAFFFT